MENLTPHFKFHPRLYLDIPQGAEIPHKEQVTLLAPSLKILNNEKFKMALDILSMSISNRVFGGENLMVESSQARGHGKLVAKTLFYGKFNPSDFSILGSYNRIGFKLEASESGEVPQFPIEDELDNHPSTNQPPPPSPSQNPPPPASPISLPFPPTPPPNKACMSKLLMRKYEEIEAMLEEWRLGYSSNLSYFQPNTLKSFYI